MKRKGWRREEGGRRQEKTICPHTCTSACFPKSHDLQPTALHNSKIHALIYAGTPKQKYSDLWSHDFQPFRMLNHSDTTCEIIVASYPGLLTPAFVACSTNVGEGLVKLSHVV